MLQHANSCRIMLLNLPSGATLLLLDEPTDNLDLVSSEALEIGLQQFNGTVVTVTHDRWFLRNFDRYLVFGDDCNVSDHTTLPPTWAD
jgi:sulfate-transporting ATPase